MSELIRLLSIIILTACLGAPLAVADEWTTAPVDEHTIQSVLNQVHSDLEASESAKGFWGQLASKFDFAGFVRQSIRAYLISREKSETTALNVVFMLGASHATETLSAPVYFLYGIVNGHTYEVLIPTTSALASQALPGIDFLCLVLAGTYAGSPDFRDVITHARVHTVKAVNRVSQFLGTDRFFKMLIQREPALQALQRRRESVRVERGEDKSTIALIDRRSRVAAKLIGHETAEGKFIVESLWAHSANMADASLSDLAFWSEQLGWNVRDVLKQVHQSVQEADPRRLLGLAYVNRMMIRDAGGGHWDVHQKAEGHTAGSCSHGNCHHHGEASHFVTTERIYSLFPEFSSEPDLQIHFAQPAIQIGAFRSMHFKTALLATPKIFLDTAGRVSRLVLTSPVWGAKALAHAPGFLWNSLLATPQVGLKSGKIGYQLTTNSAKGVVSLARTAKSCLIKIAGLRAQPTR